MKLYDEPLLQFIWERQLVEVSNRVLHHYVGGEYCVCSDNEFWFNASAFIANRTNITKELRREQLLVRLKRFYDRGMLSYYGRHYQYFLPTEQARDAFRFARQFYLNQGVPVSDGNGPISKKISNVESLRAACHQALVSRFRQIDYNQVYGLAKHKAMKEKAAA